MNSNLNNYGLVDFIKKFNYKDLALFLIPFLIFMFYLYVFNPGILTYDSYNQLHQIATGQFTNWHPFFHTFIEMLCLKIWDNPMSIAILQILVFSTMWMVICKYLRQEKTKKINKLFIYQVIVTLIISLIPINAIYSITLWKDILFSYFLMFVCFLIKVLIDKEGQVSYKFILILSLTMAFVSQLRLNGLYVTLILLIVLSAYLFIKNETDRVYLVLPILTIIFILLIASLNGIYDVQDNQKDAVFEKTAHVLAFYDLNLDLADSDREKINEMISEKDIKENFKISNLDPIYKVSNHSSYNKYKDAYNEIVIRYALQNPLDFIGYLFNSAPMVWDITKDESWKMTACPMEVDKYKNNFYSAYNATPETNYDGATAKNVGSDGYNSLFSLVENTEHNNLSDILFNNPALCMFLSLIILVILQFLTKSNMIYLVYLPNLLSILTVFVSTPVQDIRYLYANLLVFYLLVIILIAAIFKD